MIKRTLLMGLLALSLLFGVSHSSSFLSVSQPSKIENVTDISQLKDLDSIVNQSLKKFNVQGLSIGIVKDGKVILTKGYGLRDKEKNLPVTKDTVFGIASLSKGFTAFILTQLAEEGAISLDDPVIKYIPEFKLGDSYITENVTVRDLLTHQSGLPRHDSVWFFNPQLSKEELLKRLQYLEPSYDPHEKFQYNNLMYTVAGIVIERATGVSWEQNVQERILNPLDMDQTNVSIKEAKKTGNYAHPYFLDEGITKEIPFHNVTNIQPAAGLNSSVTDLTKWVELQLANGKFNRNQLIEKQTMQNAHKPLVATEENKNPFANGYGLGWGIENYKGHYSVFHDGCIDGFYSKITMLPNDKIGVVVLCNNSEEGTVLVPAVINSVLDRLLGVKKENWTKIEMSEYKKELKENAGSAEKQEALTRSLHDYVGTYYNPGYGTINVYSKNHKLYALFGETKIDLEYLNNDVFDGTPKNTGMHEGWNFAFLANPRNAIDELQIPFEPSVSPITFFKT